MRPASPEDVILALNAAFTAGRQDDILPHYEADAVVMPEPGQEFRGIDALSALYAGSPQPFISNVVIRRQPDGVWKVAINNARGPLVLESAGAAPSPVRPVTSEEQSMIPG